MSKGRYTLEVSLPGYYTHLLRISSTTCSLIFKYSCLVPKGFSPKHFPLKLRCFKLFQDSLPTSCHFLETLSSLTRSAIGSKAEVLKYLDMSLTPILEISWPSIPIPIPGIDQFLEELVNTSRIGQFLKNWSNLRKNDCFQLIYVELRHNILV